MTKAESITHTGTPGSSSDDPLWYKDAVIYQLHVKSFFDSNNDGIGDFPGLIAKLDYIQALGVNTIWLLPFYKSPRRDDGYDIAEYRSVHPEYGTLRDVRRFVAEAHRRGMRIITELVINHTSDQHPWFQRARQARPGSAARDFYVWSDSNERYSDTRIIFIDTEKSNWSWDPVANAYYWHRFYSHQPDLNFDNPRVLEAILSVMHYWLRLGVDGLRLDAVPYLIEREGTNNENLPETHEVLKRIRAEIDREFPNVMLLAEANQWPEDTQPYFGDGDECHMAFHFPLMPRIYMALAQEDRFPITDILRQTPDIPDSCQWAIFLRNHDELTLEMVTDKERDYLWEQYAVDRRARLNLGIRRRLAPLMERDRRRVELLNSLLLSMPGTPIIYYGDEIGMGDNIYLGDRDGVRTPMQWSPDRNGGFSRADPSSLVLPPIMDPLYGFESINVESQSRDPHSLLNWTRRLLDVRNMHRAFGRGRLRMLAPANRRILAYLREYTDDAGHTETILCVANVSRQAQPVEIDLSGFQGYVPVEMIGGVAFPPIGQLSYLLTVQPYGFYWFMLTRDTQLPPWYAAPPEPLPDYITLVLHGQGLLIDSRRATQLERDVLPVYIGLRRWFSAKDAVIRNVRFVAMLPLSEDPVRMLHTEIEVETDRDLQRYQLPLGVAFDEEVTGPLLHQLACARVRRGPRVGFLTDAFVMKEYVALLLTHMRSGESLVGDRIGISFRRTLAAVQLDDLDLDNLRWIGEEQSNSSVTVDDRVIIKLFRRLAPGPHPEVEMGRVLTERGYANVAALIGEIWRSVEDEQPCILAIAQRYVSNQGDGWSWLLDRFQRLAAEQAASAAQELEICELEQPLSTEVLGVARSLGTRLGQLHEVLAQPCDDPDFDPLPAGPEDCEVWAGRVMTLLGRAHDLLQSRLEDGPAEEIGLIEELLAQWSSLDRIVMDLAARGAGTLKLRIHGDLHLGQVLVVQDDIYFIDFEGEPALPLEQRRDKQSALRDVAGIFRSVDYAVETALQGSEPGITAPADAVGELRRLQAQFETEFLQAYRMTVQSDPDMGGVDTAVSDSLLDLFVLEKAAYELGYEAMNRPDWFGVPLRGLYRLLGRLGGSPRDA